MMKLSHSKFGALNHMMGVRLPSNRVLPPRIQVRIDKNYLSGTLPGLIRLAQTTESKEVILALIERYARVRKEGVGRQVMEAVIGNPATRRAVARPSGKVDEQILLALHATVYARRLGIVPAGRK